MQLRHTVNFVAGDHRKPCHPHFAAIAFIDNRDTRQQAIIIGDLFRHFFQEVIVNLENNLQMTRQDFADHVYRPGFQRFAHQRVVGVREHAAYGLPRGLPLEFMLVD
ncbi:hypothetical protein SRABI106_03709 [Rahnella aquatilis]|nr:hypothetical protein SRABI106_03709 [Rahnella aquatilis]